MLLTLLHPGDLTLWELFMILVVGGIVLLVVIGAPLGLIVYIVYKFVRHRREMSESKPR